jgi:hypothetical protein
MNVKRDLLLILLLATWLGGCAMPEGRTEESQARLSAHCSDLSRQMGEAANRPVRRSELQRQFDQECLAR